MSTDPFQSMEKAEESGKKGKETNHKSTLNYVSDRFNGTFEEEFHEVKVDKLVELEGVTETILVDEKGNPVEKEGGGEVQIEAHRPWQYSAQGPEGSQLVEKTRIRKILRYEDGSFDPYFDLPKTKTININEKRPVAEVILDQTDPSVSHGTVIPVDEVDRYSVVKTQQARSGVNTNYIGWASYLMERQVAAFYNFCFGRGRSVLTVIQHPVKVDGKLYMVKKFATGQNIFTWPIEPPVAGASGETAPVAMPVLRIRNRRAAQPS